LNDVIGWGWYYLSSVLDDFSRYIVAWKLCTTMAASDVTATLERALHALTPADVYFGRGQRMLDRRSQIKLSTIDHRRSLHFAEAA
jgi:transposase InsO family protein